MNDEGGESVQKQDSAHLDRQPRSRCFHMRRSKHCYATTIAERDSKSVFVATAHSAHPRFETEAARLPYVCMPCGPPPKSWTWRTGSRCLNRRAGTLDSAPRCRHSNILAPPPRRLPLRLGRSSDLFNMALFCNAPAARIEHIGGAHRGAFLRNNDTQAQTRLLKFLRRNCQTSAPTYATTLHCALACELIRLLRQILHSVGFSTAVTRHTRPSPIRSAT